MSVRLLGLGLTTGLVLVLGGACSKSAPSDSGGGGSPKGGAPQAAVPAASPDVAARIHWLGKKQLAADTNSFVLMSIWALPESVKLEAQVLDKLALALWPAALTNLPYPITNYPALVASHANPARLRPLLDDLLQEESFLEVRTPTNRPAEAAFAIRLDAARAALWESNLAAVVESVTGARPVPAKDGQPGWESVPGSNASAPALSWRLTRTGDWTLLGFSPKPGTNSLLAELCARIQSRPGGTPFVATNSWLDAALDLRRVATALSLGWQLPTNLPAASITMASAGENVRTLADFDFPSPLHLELEPWNVPTNLIHDPLIGFTAVRGIRPLLKDFKPWNDLKLGTPPNQAFFWSQMPTPGSHFLALPSAQAGNQVEILGAYFLSELNPIFDSTQLGRFVRSGAAPHFKWTGAPVLSPDLEFVDQPQGPFIVAGFSGERMAAEPLPAGLLPQFVGLSNIVCYDWEVTGQSIQSLTPAFQILRHMFNRARLEPDPAVSWFMAARTVLGNCATTWTLSGPARLSMSRISGVGLNGAELELLMDWLESPTFPHGLNTFTAPRPPLPPPVEQ
jgi:hypothetical protein